MKLDGKQFGPLAFVAVGVAIVIDFIATVFGATVQTSLSNWVCIGSVYAVFVALTVLSAARLRSGGIVVAICTLFAIFLFVGMMVIADLAIGGSGYQAPWFLWATHSLVGLTLVGACIAAIAIVIRSMSAKAPDQRILE